MRKLLIAAVAASVGAIALPAAPASAQGWYGRGYDRNVRQELRECRRELRRADSRREYRRELRECRREIARAQRGNRYGYYGHPRGRGYYGHPRGRDYYGYGRGYYRSSSDRYWDGRRWRYRRY